MKKEAEESDNWRDKAIEIWLEREGERGRDRDRETERGKVTENPTA